MRIGAITPDRRDRPNFLARCKEYINRQTLKIDTHLIVDYPQVHFPTDITERYMHGLRKIKGECDVVFLIENDDWYSPVYIERMIRRWNEFGRPSIFGIGETYFYHIPSQMYIRREHPERACAYATMIATEVIDKIDPRNFNPLLFDMGIWKQLKGPTAHFAPLITIGIKHGFGYCGAAGHTEWMYKHEKESVKDSHYKWLTAQMGEEDAEWYIDMVKRREQ